MKHGASVKRFISFVAQYNWHKYLCNNFLFFLFCKSILNTFNLVGLENKSDQSSLKFQIMPPSLFKWVLSDRSSVQFWKCKCNCKRYTSSFLSSSGSLTGKPNGTSHLCQTETDCSQPERAKCDRSLLRLPLSFYGNTLYRVKIQQPTCTS